MNYKVPFLNGEYIKQKADLFREKFWGDIIPVNIEKIVDVKLKIDIILVPDLQRLCCIDAFIASSWDQYVLIKIDIWMIVIRIV